MTIAKHASSGQLSENSTPSKREKGSGGVVDPPEESGASPGEASSAAESLQPQMAVRLDGVPLARVTDAEARDLSGCELEVYMVLRGEREARARTHLANSGADFGSRELGQFPMKRR